ncbi:DapH/DapD/GlmU-related protein [Streptococcus sp. FSL R7-0212]|uniref:DapH/DapD/GlmU-related protein n=1 Tax=Streptococcus sp. FSL R7-0212 TaxID=2921726 RepID=UPI0030F60C2A
MKQLKQVYSPTELFNNIRNLIYTKIFWPKARLIRRPFFIRGKNYLKYGNGLTIGYFCRFEVYRRSSSEFGCVEIGDNCKFGDRVHISSVEKISIGKNSLFASNILITDNEHGKYKGENQASPLEYPDDRKLFSEPVIIGENCWTGENVVILPGTVLGNGTIVGANSVVKGNFPDYSIIGGSPAKILKRYDFEHKIWKREIL